MPGNRSLEIMDSEQVHELCPLRAIEGSDTEGYAKPRYYSLTDRCPKCIETWRHAAQDNKQRLLRTIERRFSRQTFHAGEAVAIRSYVGT
jgi:hypothetical protein